MRRRGRRLWMKCERPSGLLVPKWSLLSTFLRTRLEDRIKKWGNGVGTEYPPVSVYLITLHCLPSEALAVVLWI